MPTEASQDLKVTHALALGKLMAARRLAVVEERCNVWLAENKRD